MDPIERVTQRIAEGGFSTLYDLVEDIHDNDPEYFESKYAWAFINEEVEEDEE